jgi:hypothetical protein
MKVIANLGKLDDQRTALIIDNEYFPYYIVNGYNGETEGDNLWAWTVQYYDKLTDFAKAITCYDKSGIGWHRMCEIASKVIDKIIEDDAYEAEEFLREEVELTDEEADYFCIAETMDTIKRYEEEDDLWL